MKTATEYHRMHIDLHERFRRGKIGVRAFEAAIHQMWIDARADGVDRELGEIIKADIKVALAETRERLATEGFTWKTADGRTRTYRLRRTS